MSAGLAESRSLTAWFRADVAQLVEHSLGKGEVTSSILVIGSRVRDRVRDRDSDDEGRGFRLRADGGMLTADVRAGVTQW